LLALRTLCTQVPVVQAAFSPSAADVEAALALVAAFHEHQGRGHGAFVYEGACAAELVATGRQPRRERSVWRRQALLQPRRVLLLLLQRVRLSAPPRLLRCAREAVGAGIVRRTQAR
jgi:hypothetical protein